MELGYSIWEDARHEAIIWNEKRIQAAQKYVDAVKNNNRKNQIIFSKEMEECEIKSRQQHAIAADLVFRFHNEKLCNPTTTIDLHGLYVTEALEKVVERINTLIGSGIDKLDVIVGQGLHSRNGPKIKPSVMDFAATHEIDYTIPSDNPGLLRMSLADTMLVTARKKRTSATLDQYLVVKKPRTSKKSKKRTTRIGDSRESSPTV